MENNEITFSFLLNSIAKFSVSSWVNFAIGIIAVIITTRIFTPDIYGLLNIFNTASALLIGFSTLGLDGAFLRFFHEPPDGWDKRSLFAKCLSYSVLFLFVITFIVLVFFNEQISLSLFNKVSFYFTVLLSVNAVSLMVLNNYCSQFYRLDNDSYHYNIQVIIVQFFSKLFVVCAAIVTPTAEVVLTFNTIGIFIVMLIYSYIQHATVFPDKYKWSNEGLKEVFRYALYSWPLTIAMPITAFLIPFIIKTQLSVYDLGIYSSAAFFVTAFAVIQGGFRTFWAAFMYGHYKTEQTKIIKVHNYIIIFIIALLGSFILFQHVAYLFIGSKFHSSRLFFTLVLLDPLLLLLEQTTSYGTAIAKKNQQMTIIYISAMILNICITYFMLPVVGLIGAAIGSATAAVFRFALSSWRGQKYYRSISSWFSTILGVALILLLGISNCVFANQYIIEVIIVFGIFAITFLVFFNNFQEVYRYVRKIW